jgi:penicillin-binding protein 1B
MEEPRPDLAPLPAVSLLRAPLLARKSKKPPPKKKRRSPKRPAKAPFRKRLWAWTKKLVLLSLVGAAIGAAAVGAVFYRQALHQVQVGLQGQVWELTGKTWSAPMQIWPGLTLTEQALATDLVQAGYAQVDQVDAPGDFQVGSGAVLVRVRSDSGPGWRLQAGDIMITFRSGKVHTVSPQEPAILPPSLLASLRGPSNEARTPRELEDFPESLRQAVLAMEDSRFFEHPGVSLLGIFRAVVVNTLRGGAVQGGSTLTQQLAKNLFLSPERTLSRKAQEALLAFALENQLSKREILALYLNEIYWGQVGGAAICGADEASRAYFGKPVDRIGVAEAATLAGIISAPNSYSPLRHPEKAKKRRDIALGRMVAVGWLAPEKAEKLKATPLVVHASPTGRRAPYAVDAAVEFTDQQFGAGTIAREGLQVHTGIQPALQRLAEASVAQSIAEMEARYPKAKGAQIALVAVRVDDGSVVAMVGGRNYAESSFNRAVRAKRQPGSTVKPLILAAAFEEDPSLSPATVMLDEPIERRVSGKTWQPRNYDGKYLGELPLRDVINQSRNVPSVLLAERLGTESVRRWLHRFGLKGAGANPAIALGAFEATPLEMAAAYAIFPNGGHSVEPRLVTAVTDNAGRTLTRRDAHVVSRLSARAAWLATSVLQTVITDGTGQGAAKYGVNGAVGGKTGTTDGYRDAWFVGFSPTLAVAVWVGHDKGRNLGLTGSQAAVPAWSRFMAGSGTIRGSFPMPDSVERGEACVGGFIDGQCQECRQEVFSAGWVPEVGCEEPLGVVGGFFDRLFGERESPEDDVPLDPQAQQESEAQEESIRNRVRRHLKDRLGN